MKITDAQIEHNREIIRKQERKDQRRKIATAAMQGLLAHYGYDDPSNVARRAVEYASHLMARLDEQP